MSGHKFQPGDRAKLMSQWIGADVGDIVTVERLHSADGQYLVLKEFLAEYPNHNISAFRLELVLPEVKAERRISADTQLGKVLALTLGQGSWTLAGIASVTGASEAAVSARLRDLRAAGYVVTCTKERGDTQRNYTVRTKPIAVDAEGTATGG